MNSPSAIDQRNIDDSADWITAPQDSSGRQAGYGLPGIFDLATLRGFLFRQRYILLATIALALIAALVVTLLATPVFEARSTVRVEPQGNYIVEGQDLAPAISSSQVSQYLQTLGEVIESRKMAELVVTSLDLQSRTDLLGSEIDDSRPENISDEQWAEQKKEWAVAIVQGNVEADIPYDSRVLKIRFRNNSPTIAALVANAYAENFVADDSRRTLANNAYALEYLEGQISDIRQRLQNAELEANDYARQNGIVGPTSVNADNSYGGEGGPTITALNLAQINASYTEARSNRIELEQKWLAIADTPARQIPEVQNNEVLRDLIGQSSTLSAELANLKERYDNDYPSVAELSARLAELDRQIAGTGEDIKAGIRSQFEVARRQEQALSREVGRVSRDTLDEQDRRVRYGLLDREASAIRVQLATLLDRFNEISSAENVQTGSIALLDPAVDPTSPISPNLTRNLLIALILGAGLALTIAILREVFDDRLRSLAEVEDRFGVPLLGHTPHLSANDLDDADSASQNALQEAYSSIALAIDYTIPKQHRVLQFTSSQASEGKTTSAIALAEKYAKLGYKTLLVDADLRRPAMAGAYSIDRPENGFVEVLQGKVELSSALLANQLANLDVLPLGSIPNDPVEFMASGYIRTFIAQYRTEYDYIIFDSSPVVGIADAPILSRLVDATIFIVEANRIHFGQAKAALRRLRSAGATIPGMILTKYRPQEAGQSYGYEYQYYSYAKDG
ncbi:MAG: polysaccharide biosynthesis tyrosine autokinase [Erythrobacter sp.]